MSNIGRRSGHSDDMAQYLGMRLYISISAESIIFHALLSTCPKVVRLLMSRAVPAQSCIPRSFTPIGMSIISHCDHDKAFSTSTTL